LSGSGAPSPAAAGRRSAALLVPLALAAAAYARVLHGEFQFDDRITVEQNPLVKSLGRFLSEASLLPPARPLTDLTFALNYAAGRLDPLGYHLVNLAVHLALVLLLHRLTRALARRAGLAAADGVALAAAGIFAVHPLQSQAVSYVSQRAESLASLFYVASLLLLLRAERRGWGAAGLLAWGGAFLLFLLGLEAKAIVVTLPAAWLLLAGAVPDRGRDPVQSGRALPLAIPFAAASALYAQAAMAGLAGRADVGLDVPGLSAGRYFLTQLRVVAGYLRLLVWPSGQVLDPEVRVSTGLDGSTAAAGLLLASLLLVAVALLSRSRRWEGQAGAAARLAALGLLWFFLVLAPTSSVIPVVDLMQEHRAYLAAWGPILALVVGAERLLVRLAPPRRELLTRGALLSIWLALAGALLARNAVWETRVALWSDVVAKAPGKARGHQNLGHSLMLAGKLEESVASYRRVLERLGDGTVERSDALRNLAVVLIEAQRPREAAQVTREALVADPWNVDLLNNLAIALLDLGDLAGAEANARRALVRKPDDGPSLNTLGEAQLARGDAAGALASFSAAAALDPDVEMRHYNVALAASRLGRVAEACEALARFRAADRRGTLRREAGELSGALGCRP